MQDTRINTLTQSALMRQIKRDSNSKLAALTAAHSLSPNVPTNAPWYSVCVY